MNFFHLTTTITPVFSLFLISCDIPRNQRKTSQTKQENTQSPNSLTNTSQPKNSETCDHPGWMGCSYQEEE